MSGSKIEEIKRRRLQDLVDEIIELHEKYSEKMKLLLDLLYRTLEK